MDAGWAYTSIIDRLTNGDITKDEDVFQIEWEYSLTKLLYYKEKDEYIESLNRIREQKLKR